VRAWSLEQSSVVAATPEAVWRRVVSPEGIDDELRPWMTMAIPGGTLDIDAVRPGEPVGRAWLRLFGVVPVDYDDLVVTELEPGRRFLEESSMATMRRWVHERTVEAAPSRGTTVTDRVTFAPRVALVWAGPLLRPVLAALFAHRHRRLRRHFGGA
jgi:ligand-binding SRPBCC domain-containing protein